MPTINIKGMEGVISKIQAISPSNPGGKVNAAINAVALEIKGVISKYPPARPESKYRRTMMLFKRWSIYKGKPSGVIIGNNTSYGPYVQDRDYQAGFHQGVWRTVQDVAEQYFPIVRKRILDALRQTIK